MTEPPRTDLDIVAERCVEVIRYWQDRHIDDGGDLRLIAHFAWALGLEPEIALRRRVDMPTPDAHEKESADV